MPVTTRPLNKPMPGTDQRAVGGGLEARGGVAGDSMNGLSINFAEDDIDAAEDDDDVGEVEAKAHVLEQC